MGYYYGVQSEQYAFYRIPKLLISDSRFKRMSTESKLLYGMFIDRMGLSKQNGWIDSDGKVYIYYKIDNVCEDMNCATKKACGIMSELEKAGLIERVKQGQGNPDRIYLMNFADIVDKKAGQFQTCQKDNSRIVKSTSQDLSKLQRNNTEYNNTEMNNIYPIQSYPDNHTDGGDGNREETYAEYEEYFRERLEIAALKTDFPYEHRLIDNIVELIVEVMCSNRKVICIASDDKPIGIVKSRFMKLDSGHIRYVLDSFGENTTKVRNIKQYLLAALFNAPTTIDGHYSALVRHDMAQGYFNN